MNDLIRLGRSGAIARASLLLGSFVVIGASTPARAVGIGPSITISVDNSVVQTLTCGLGLVCDPIKGTATLPVALEIGSVLGEYLITLHATDLIGPNVGNLLEPDPEIFYGASVIDFGGPSSFGFIFQQGIVPTEAPGYATHDYSSSTTDGTSNGVPVGYSAPPAGIPEDGSIDEIAVYTLSTDGGTNWVNAAMDLAAPFSGPAGTSGTQGPFAEAGPGPLGSGFYDAMRVDVNFTMGGGNDGFTFNGHASIVPEPSTATLLMLGLAAIAVRSRSRR